MSFADPIFVFFIALVWIGAALLRDRSRIRFLTVMSYLFYGYANPPYVLLLLISTCTDFAIGAALARSTSVRRRKALVAGSLAVNLGLLGYFKYAGLALEWLQGGLAALGFDVAFAAPSIILPIGISFYTFQTISYTVDIYRRQIEPTDSLLDFAFFVSFFPQLVAGPIVRASEFLHQIRSKQPLLRDDVIVGIELILLGMFKKRVIADNIAAYVDPYYAAPSDYSGAVLWMATLCFSVQIYCDFSGYTDIARGLARTLGFTLPVNFSWPYLSGSIREFWRRWHRTLSFFIRDYLYFSLGGNRGHASIVAFNLLLTWFLCGLWHGAQANFVAWGIFHGTLIVLHATMTSWSPTRHLLAALPRPLAIVSTYLACVVGWVLFRANTVDEIQLVLGQMFGAFGSLSEAAEVLGSEILIGFAILVAAHVATHHFQYDGDTRSILRHLPYPARVITVAATALVIMIAAGSDQAFIYFRF